MAAITKAERLPELDGLRALASLMVVVSHIPEFDKSLVALRTGGRFGVMLFFVLSGFLMGTLYLRAPFTRDSVVKYAVARAIRIAPIYLTVVIAAYFITTAWPGFIYALNNGNIVRHLFFSGNVAMFWSIPPEVQFYVVFIVIWWAAAVYRTQNILLPLIVVFAVVLTFMSYYGHFPGTFVGSHIQFFVGGLFAALIRPRFVALMQDRQSLLFAQLCLLILFAWTSFSPTTPFGPDDSIRFNGDARAIIPMLMVLLMSMPTRISTPLFANPWMRAIGAWSFSLYLVHLAVLQLASFIIPVAGVPAYIVLGVSAAIALSALTYRLIERPSQNLKPAIQNAIIRLLDARLMPGRRSTTDVRP